MSALFRKSEEHAAEEAAAAAELERLTALPAIDLAREVMPAYGSGGPGGSGAINAVQVAQWLMESHPGRPSLKPLIAPVQQAIQALESAGLVESKTSGIGTGSSSAKATPLGGQALAEGTVDRYLTRR